MNPMNESRTLPAPASGHAEASVLSTNRVVRNTYLLLSMTLLWSSIVAGVTMVLKLPHPGLIITLVGYFGLLFLVNRFRDQALGLVLVFALTGFMGYTLGPMLSAHLALPGGAQTIALALGATGATFLALSGWVLATRRDFGFMGGFLFAGMVIALLAGLAVVFFKMPALSLAVSAMVALLSAGLILFETSRIVNGGETNYVMATVGLFVSIFNLFTSLLSLFGFGGSND